MHATYSELRDGTMLRTSVPPAEPMRDVNGDLMPPSEALIFHQLADDETCRGFHMAWALSADWEQHPTCGGPEGALARCGVDGRRHTYVWRMPIPRVRATLDIGEQRTISLRTLHWPEEYNPSHSHILFSCVASAKKAKRVARHYLQREAGVRLAIRSTT